MKIGIDLGGSHIAVGLVKEDKIILKKERDFEEKDKNSIEKVIEEQIERYIEEILKEENLELASIEQIRNISTTVEYNMVQ